MFCGMWNPVQNKVITAKLNAKADKDIAFTGYLEATIGESTGEYEFDFDSIDNEGVYLLRHPSIYDDTPEIYYILSVCVSYDKTMLIQTLYRLDDGTIEKRSNKGIWEKISISQYDLTKATKDFVTQTNLNTAIGDIETSLENIIQKYGLGNSQS